MLIKEHEERRSTFSLTLLALSRSNLNNLLMFAYSYIQTEDAIYGGLFRLALEFYLAVFFMSNKQQLKLAQ